MAEFPPSRSDGLIVERLDGETLVYDTASDEAHCLGAVAAEEFEAAEDDVSRREVIRRLALAGAVAAGAAPLIKTVAAPTPAHAASANCGPLSCAVGQTCCLGTGGTGSDCCDPGELCCSGVCYNPATNTCCGALACTKGHCCPSINAGGCFFPCDNTTCSVACT